MGFLAEGRTLKWEESKEAIARVKHDGITQLLCLWTQNMARNDKELRWGDEMEILLVHLDAEKQTAKVWLGADKMLDLLQQKEKSEDWCPTSATSKVVAEAAGILTGCSKRFLFKACWHPEFASYMVEATPGSAFDLSVDSLVEVEDSMISRRYKVQSLLPPNVYACTMSVFPMLGLNDFTSLAGLEVAEAAMDKSADSLFIPKAMINSHPRFATLVENICKRSGAKPKITMPVYMDTYTAESPMWKGSLSDQPLEKHRLAKCAPDEQNPEKGQIYMDHFGFGMGNCCLQTTYMAPNISEARYLYDQLAVLSPIFLAVSAASPVFRGLISDVDVRWRTLEQGCDCRTESELEQIPKSRYGPISTFIADDEYLRNNLGQLNDFDIPIDNAAFSRLLKSGMDPILARHFAWLWMRDPLVIYDDNIDLDNTARTDHFENLQSTNWNSVRFKPPPPAQRQHQSGGSSIHLSPIGWRVEFRTPDVQLSDFENAAIAGIVTLLAMAILRDHLNFYIPISKVNQNFRTAEMRNAILRGKFWFRNDLNCDGTDDSHSLMTMREIFLGSKRTGFCGLLPMLDKFVSREWRARKCSFDAVEKYRQYADLIRQRVRGSAWTNAADIRYAMMTHADYERESTVTSSMNYSICCAAVRRGFCPYVNLPMIHQPSERLLAVIRCANNNAFCRQLLSSLKRFDVNESENAFWRHVSDQESDASTRGNTPDDHQCTTCREDMGTDVLDDSQGELTL